MKAGTWIFSARLTQRSFAISDVSTNRPAIDCATSQESVSGACTMSASVSSRYSGCEASAAAMPWLDRPELSGPAGGRPCRPDHAQPPIAPAAACRCDSAVPSSLSSSTTTIVKRSAIFLPQQRAHAAAMHSDSFRAGMTTATVGHRPGRPRCAVASRTLAAPVHAPRPDQIGPDRHADDCDGLMIIDEVSACVNRPINLDCHIKFNSFPEPFDERRGIPPVFTGSAR